jgi:hypothetical protein
MFMSTCTVLEEHVDTYDAYKSINLTLSFSLVHNKLIIVKWLMANKDTE